MPASSSVRLVNAAGNGSGTLLKSVPAHFVWLKNSWLQGAGRAIFELH
jgi:hypothetical protein